MLVKTGDEIEVDVAKRRIHLHVSDAELARRHAAVAALFPQHIAKADRGCGFDFLKGPAATAEPEIH